MKKNNTDAKNQAIASFVQQIRGETILQLNENKVCVRFRKGKATLFCEVCGIQFKTVSLAQTHIEQQSHSDTILAEYLNEFLKHLPPISESHRQALNRVLEETSCKATVPYVELDRRRDVAKSICTALEACIRGLRMHLIGSTRMGLIEVSSDVNLDASVDTSSVVSWECRLSSHSSNSNSRQCIDPYKKGFGSLLSEIYEVLELHESSGFVEKRNDVTDTGLSRLPHIQNIQKCMDAEYFRLSLQDHKDVLYTISVGNPYGPEFSDLIMTYLSIDERARKLAILVKKFAKLSRIAQPSRNTFRMPVIYVLVIFFLQFTSPPILPNLQQIYRMNKDRLSPDSVVKVVTEEGDFSFLKDISLLPQMRPFTSTGDAPGLGENRFTLADLWLQLLHFYTFDFKSNTWVVSIRSSVPVLKSSRKFSPVLWVEDPFSPKSPMTKGLTSYASKFIRNQLLAAYSYFAIPRLARTSRPLFTKVKIVVEEHDSLSADRNPAQGGLSKNTYSKIPLRSLPDSSSKFELQLDQTSSAFVVIFDEKLKQTHENRPDPNDLLQKFIPLNKLLPDFVRLALTGVCLEKFVEGVVQMCMVKVNNRFRNSKHLNVELDANESKMLLRSYCREFWCRVAEIHVSSQPESVGVGRLARLASKALHTILKSSLILEKKTPPSSAARTPEKTAQHLFEPTAAEPLQAHEISVPVEGAPDCCGVTVQFDDDNEAGIPECDVGRGSKQNVNESPMETNLSTDTETWGEEGEVLQGAEEDSLQTDDEVSLADEEVFQTGKLALQGEKETISHDPEQQEEVTKQEVSPACPSHRAENKSLKKSLCINSEDYVKIIDSEEPDYYNSKDAKALRPEDLSFPFDLEPHYVGGESQNQQPSVLGLSHPNAPSSMLSYYADPEPFCVFCGLKGHEGDACNSNPNMSASLSVWRNLKQTLPPAASSQHLAELSNCLIELSVFHSSEQNNAYRQMFIFRLNNLFRQKHPTVSLKLFGSCANGFETATSDMDICVFFPPEAPESSMLLNIDDRITLMKNFKKMLHIGSRSLGISKVRPVLSAKVPIIKFMVDGKFEVDLSFSNFLAISNTSMLRFYNEIEPRLRVLTIALKSILKVCRIPKGDSGGISSYAYVIMMIHYLQQKNFLPVLQELYEGSERPSIEAGDWNAWYQDDMKIVRKLWHPPEKDVSVAELWFGFFRYYLFDFDRQRYVITINQRTLLDRMSKLWNSLLAIEDPFNLRHNLTNFVQRPVFLQVLTLFYNVLVHHTTFIRGDLHFNNWKYLIFSSEKIGAHSLCCLDPSKDNIKSKKGSDTKPQHDRSGSAHSVSSQVAGANIPQPSNTRLPPHKIQPTNPTTTNSESVSDPVAIFPMAFQVSGSPKTRPGGRFRRNRPPNRPSLQKDNLRGRSITSGRGFSHADGDAISLSPQQPFNQHRGTPSFPTRGRGNGTSFSGFLEGFVSRGASGRGDLRRGRGRHPS